MGLDPFSLADSVTTQGGNGKGSMEENAGKMTLPLTRNSFLLVPSADGRYNSTLLAGRVDLR